MPREKGRVGNRGVEIKGVYFLGRREVKEGGSLTSVGNG